jgi:hypothetical protein
MKDEAWFNFAHPVDTLLGHRLGGTGKLVGFVPNPCVLGGSGKRSLPMVCPFAIGKAFGLATATRLHSLHKPNLKNLGRTQQVWRRHPARVLPGLEPGQVLS